MVLQLATNPGLQEFRHSVICILGQQGEFSKAYTKNGVPTQACPMQWPVTTPIPSYQINRWIRHHLVFTFPWRLARLLKHLRADLVHTHVTTPQIHLQSQAILRFAHLPWIWTLRGLYRSRGEDASHWPQALQALEQAPAAALTAVSRAALEEALALRTLPSHKALVISNGIDLSEYSPSLGPGPQLREKWGIPRDALVFGTAGRLIPVKRMDLFIEAAAVLIGNGIQAHFVIAGDGSLRDELAETIRARAIADHIHLAGYQEDMKAFFRALDVFVLSSDSEGFPNALLEACAMGLPCASTAVGGVPDLLAEEAGLLVLPGNPAALAQAMEQMLSAETRQKYAERSHAVAEKFSASRMCSDYSALYRKLIACSGERQNPAREEQHT